MNLFYISNTGDYHYDLYDDNSAFYCLFLFAEKISCSSYLTFLVAKYLARTKWGEKELIDLFYFFVDESDHFWTKEEAADNFKLVRKIKNRQITGQGVAKMLMAFNHNKDVMREYISSEFEIFFEDADFDLKWIPLFENKFVKPEVFYIPEIHPDNLETELMDMIRDKIISGNEMFLFRTDIRFHKKNFYLEETVYDNSLNYEIYSMPFFTFLYNGKISKENMMILRGNILGIISPLSEMMQEFRKNISAEIYSHSIHEKIVAFHETLKPLREVIQKKLDDQIYFQGMKNSTDDSREIEIRADVSSLNLIIDFIGSSGILPPFIANAIKQNLALQKDLDKCEMFLDFSFND